MLRDDHEYQVIPIAETPADFQTFIGTLRDAVTARDAGTIHGLLDDDYMIERDFGGTYQYGAAPEVNFAFSYQLDNTRLLPDYQDRGWNELAEDISGNSFELTLAGEFCTSPGAQEHEPFPVGQLCFGRRGFFGNWRIVRHINGGD